MTTSPSSQTNLASTSMNDNGKKRHTTYHMQIQVGDSKYTIDKRYTEFLMLHQRIQEHAYPEIENFQFPRKVYFSRYSETLIAYRRKKFEQYLELLFNVARKHKNVKVHLENFLGMQANSRKSTLQQESSSQQSTVSTSTQNSTSKSNNFHQYHQMVSETRASIRKRITSKEKSLEVTVEDFASARRALAGGIDRIELCSNLSVGGLTPSLGLIEKVAEEVLAHNRQITSGDSESHSEKKSESTNPKNYVELVVLIRPRCGDFIYTNEDIDIMKKEIKAIRQVHGVSGIVIGALTKDKKIDKESMIEFIKLIRIDNSNIEVIFHRAFDDVENHLEALQDLIDLKIDRLLTSGCHQTAMEGLPILAELVDYNKNKGSLKIMAGSGINIDNVKEIINKAGTYHIHVGSGATSDIENISDLISENAIKESKEITEQIHPKSLFSIDRKMRTIDPVKIQALWREIHVTI